MDNDDLPVGRVLDRREAVKLLAMTSAAVLAGCNRSSAASTDTPSVASNTTVPGCVVRPELTVGPYFVDHQLERSDIRTDPATGIASPGVPLDLTFTVSQISGGKCIPLQGAVVDVWHCDAFGQYSAVNDRMEGFNTLDKKFLRGFQKTSDIGVARFTTIYPGWYRGRTVHIHFKIRAPYAPDKQYDFTSQLFFDDAFSDKIFAQAPYNAKGQRDLRNSGDGIFRQGGSSLLVNVGEMKENNGTFVRYLAAFDLALDLSNIT